MMGDGEIKTFQEISTVLNTGNCCDKKKIQKSAKDKSL